MKKIIEKIPTGISFFDKAYGGVYKGRTMLLTGRHGSGKTVASLQFIGQGLKNKERCLLLSARPAEDVALTATAFNIPIVESIDSGDCFILEYKEYVPGRDREDELKLPKDSFIQLKHIIEDQKISRVVLDTVLPWVALDEEELLPEHVFSFIRVFQRMGVSTLFTIPKPASPPAIKLRKLIENVVPVSVSIESIDGENRSAWVVNKYLGAPINAKPTPFYIGAGVGITDSLNREPQQVREKSRSGAPPKIQVGGSDSFANLLLSSKDEGKGAPSSMQRIKFKDAAKGL